MTTTIVHNPDRYMSDLRQVLSQGRKRIGIFIGAGAPTAIQVDDSPLVPDVKGLTDAVVKKLENEDRKAVDALKADLGENVNVEIILTRVRKLAQVIGSSRVHGLDAVA